MRGYSYGNAGYSTAGYGYATIASSREGALPIKKRPHRSNTFSWFPNGYTAFSGGKIVDKNSSSTHQGKRSRHRAESGPASSIFSPLQSGVSSPKGKASLESSREARIAEKDAKSSRYGGRRSTTSRYEVPRHRKQSEHKQFVRKKSHAEKKSIPRHSFASLTSRGTAPSIASRRQSTATKASRKRKSKGGYGLLSCFGR